MRKWNLGGIFMIYGNIHHEKTYAFLPAAIQQALAFARTHDLAALPAGRNEIAGDDLYVNIAHYTTAPRTEKVWEGHTNYIDVHILAEGMECIDVSPIEDMQMGEYVKERDLTPAEGDVRATAILRPDDFLICFPEDIHRSGVMVDEPAPLKKGIFKVRVR